MALLEGVEMGQGGGGGGAGREWEGTWRLGNQLLFRGQQERGATLLPDVVTWVNVLGTVGCVAL